MPKFALSHKNGTEPVVAGTVVTCTITDPDSTKNLPADATLRWTVTGPIGYRREHPAAKNNPSFDFDTSGLRGGQYWIECQVIAPTQVAAGQAAAPAQAVGLAGVGEADAASTGAGTDAMFVNVAPPAMIAQNGSVPVSLQRTALESTPDQILWMIIRNRTDAISFRSYQRFIDKVMASQMRMGTTGRPVYRGSDAYELLKQGTNAFLMHETGSVGSWPTVGGGVGKLDPDSALESVEQNFARVAGEERRRLGRDVTLPEIAAMRRVYYGKLNAEPGMLPYIRIIVDRLAELPIKDPWELVGDEDGEPDRGFGYAILPASTTPVAIELINSYWQLDEGGIAQTLNHIVARFQGRRPARGADPLARCNFDFLRPWASIFFSYIGDEIHRLTVRRRAFEYFEEYRLPLLGKVIPPQSTGSSKFLEAFHNLLHIVTAEFYPQDDDTTVIADGFPVLNALRETHLLLAEGAQNQFGDLPTQARGETLIMQWLLARPEVREFLGGKVQVPYEEPWMDRVDTMKALLGWRDVSVTHYRDLAVFGEQLLLSIRYGNWSVINDPQQAANWARYWRAEAQRYNHAYAAATGKNLKAAPDATVPAVLLGERRSRQHA